MDLLTVVSLSLVVFIIASIILYINYHNVKGELRLEIEALNRTKNELEKASKSLIEIQSQLQEEKEKALIFKLKNEQLTNRLQELLNDKSIQLQQFENIANRLLQQQSLQFGHKQVEDLSKILLPLQEKIGEFESKIQSNNIESIKQHQSLREQIKLLQERSEKVSQDANNLTKALRGDFKQQGNWGELILDSILDKSGLEKGREYIIQASMRNEDGKLLKPDVVIHLPDNKALIIDSKVSLVAYDRMVNATEKQGRDQHQKQHVFALKTHIDQLSQKTYHNLLGSKSPDFVLMFIPIDTAFSAALEYEDDLYSYAFDRNIVIVTPSTLLATLKTVDSMWRNEKQHQYAVDIANEAGKMYDKLALLVDDLTKLGGQLNTVNTTYHQTMNKLSQGKGNLLSRADKVKALGAKTTKQLNG